MMHLSVSLFFSLLKVSAKGLWRWGILFQVKDCLCPSYAVRSYEEKIPLIGKIDPIDQLPRAAFQDNVDLWPTTTWNVPPWYSLQVPTQETSF
jgi:hypothetical protein